MPGLVGFTDKNNKFNKKILCNMQRSLKHINTYIDEKLYNDNNFYCTQTKLPLFNNRLVIKNQISAWVDGEFYNTDYLKKKYNINSTSDTELFLDLYITNYSFNFLSEIDGVFAAILYDKEKNKIHLISDRFGFKPLYWTVINQNLIFSSELKGFLYHSDFNIKIDSIAINNFFNEGYLLNDRTWFENTKLIDEASVFTFNIQDSTIKKFKYWEWNEIKASNKSIDNRELAEEFKKLFIKSIDKKINKNDRIGITLSGGLDSRLILAAIDNQKINLNTFTFGQSQSYDIYIADIVSKIKGIANYSYEINSDNWLHPRIKNIWYSDGQYNILDMHGIEFTNEYKKYMDINLNGFLGDAILGGSYISNEQSTEYLFKNRGRRLINQALIMAETQILQRRPFFDNDLIDFILQISENKREKSKIYNKMLLQIYPNFFKDIPCTKNRGYPLNYSNLKVKFLKNKNKILNQFNMGKKYKMHYTNYPKWIRTNPGKSLFEKIILDKNSIFPNYISIKKAKHYLTNHLNGKNNFHQQLCLIMTFEIWLKQIYEGKYKEKL